MQGSPVHGYINDVSAISGLCAVLDNIISILNVAYINL